MRDINEVVRGACHDHRVRPQPASADLKRSDDRRGSTTSSASWSSAS